MLYTMMSRDGSGGALRAYSYQEKSPMPRPSAIRWSVDVEVLRKAAGLIVRWKVPLSSRRVEFACEVLCSQGAPQYFCKLHMIY